MKSGELVAGRYELTGRLGRGGMGEVWSARDRTLHRDVALKTLVLDPAANAELPLRFEREAVAVAQINHPNVVAVYDRGIHEDVLFLVMEQVDGGNLAELLRERGTLDLDRGLDVAEAVCAALTAAHRARVIGVLSWIPPASAVGGNETPAEQGRLLRFAAKATAVP
ncbi:serine/threonine-protein kinase [Kitasatospora xanthocidica]|uniref:serine/threonine-protein kinase n=1 Tax=Kitasatospora xanthocidica TaxID=83382 RepID=UPI0036EF91D8